MIGQGEAPLRVSDGYQLLQSTPSSSHLDAFHELSKELEKAVIYMRFDDYGWCRGVIEYRNQDRRRKFQGRLVNFVAQFDIDEGTTENRPDAGARGL